MSDLRQLVTTTDLSDPSLYAVDRGFQLAAASGARLTLLHALGLPALMPFRAFVGEPEGETIAQSIRDSRHEELSRLAAEPSRNCGVSATLRLEDAAATDAIRDHADAVDADLVLVGAHGSGFIHRFVFGSTASRLVRKSRCPVLTVKQPCQGAYRRVLVAVDFSPASLAALRCARAVAPAAHFFLLHAVEVPFEGMLSYSGVRTAVIDQYRSDTRHVAMVRLRELAEAAGLPDDRYTRLAELGEAGARLLALEQAHACDLMVMGKHGTHVTEELLLGSLTSRMLSESQADVLVVVDKRRPARSEDTYALP